MDSTRVPGILIRKRRGRGGRPGAAAASPEADGARLSDSRDFSEATPGMNDPMLPLPGLSPAGGKPVVVKFDGGLLSSDGGVLALREVERRLRLADRLASCVADPRAPDQITHLWPTSFAFGC